MARKQPARSKRVPQRMCVACRRDAGKRELVRVVRSGEGVVVDPTGKLAGRGAYLHPTRFCWQKALEQHLLQRALRTQISAGDLQALAEYAETLPDEGEAEREQSDRN